MFLLGFTALMIILTVFFFQAPLESIANPQSTPLHTVAPWYFYWLQGLLKIANKTVAGVILPGVLLGLLAGIPYLDPNPSRRGKDRRVAIISGIVAGVVMGIWTWMGTPQYAVRAAPATEIVQELIPEEGAGLVRELGYAKLPNGVYDTTAKEIVPAATLEEYEKTNPGFVELLTEFKKLTADFDKEDKDFNEPRSMLSILQEQPHLKRIKWDITWKDAKGKDGKFTRSFFIHEDSMYWEQYGLRDFSYLSKPENSK